MLKFNNLVNKIIAECSDSNIISEDVTVNDIRDMIKQIANNERYADFKRAFFRFDLKRLFSSMKYKARDNQLNNNEKIIVNDIEKNIVDADKFIKNFLSSLSNKELIPNTVILKLADAILDKVKDTVTKNDIVKLIKKVAYDSFYFWKNNYLTEMEHDYKKILHDIDASRITDDDIEVYTPETFKSYNEKVKGAFSYAIFLKENLPIAIANFNSDGNMSIKPIYDYPDPNRQLSAAL